MKKIKYIKYTVAILICLCLNFSINSQTNTQNYIQTKTMTNDSGTTFLETIQYFDGLGRPVQTVQRGFSPNKYDLITYQEYDAQGRDSASWLPVVASGNNGAFMALANFKTKATSTYNGTTYNSAADAKPYGFPVYEASPLNRITEQYGPGADWQNNKKAVKTEYLTNTSSLTCVYFYISGDNLVRSNNYANNQLYVTKTTDEDGNISYEFKDKLGRVVLLQQSGNNTYYVYDDFGNLRYVLPHLAASATGNGTYNENTQAIKDYAYIYKYDSRNRCIYKKLPGCDHIIYVYDKADRLIFTQDGEQRAAGKWFFTFPDAFGRVVQTGICEQMSIDNSSSYIDITSGCLNNIAVTANLTGYPNTPIVSGYSSNLPLKGVLYYTVNYYDNYNYMHPSGGVYSSFDYLRIDTTENNYGKPVLNCKGLLTGMRILNLTPDNNIMVPNVNDYTYLVMGYDIKGRLVQSFSKSHIETIEKEYYKYNFTDQVVGKKIVPNNSALTEIYVNSYDHAGRLTKTTHQYNGGTITTIAENIYDELGRLKTHSKGGHVNNKTTYAYNIRSWVKSISSNLFNETLFYNEQYGGSVKQYNGNISAMSWKLSDESSTRGYTFTYDNLSQLKLANYLENGSANSNYKVSYNYDSHGNMTSLKRYGKTGANSYGLIDDLVFNYSGNRLTAATDAASPVTLSESFDFKNYSASIEYNTNGAAKRDLTKGFNDIKYNFLNLPRQIEIKNPSAEARNEYTYSATGKKLRVFTKWNANFNTNPVIGTSVTNALMRMSSTTDYVNNRIYEDGVLKRTLIEGGYIENGAYYYYHTDHLGNNRVVANASGAIVQKTHYYPFGMPFTDGTASGAQPYKFGNKEFDTKHALNQYDFEARFYESTIGRFTTMDPMAEKYPGISPYVYCANNPIRNIDPDGRKWKDTQDKEIANQLQQQAASRDKSLAKQEANINAKIEKIENNAKLSTDKKTQQIATQQGKLENVQEQRSILSNFSESITQLGNSKTVFTFNTVGQGTTATLSSMTDGTVVINNYGTVGNRAHEATHAIQYDNGKMSFNPLGSNNVRFHSDYRGLEIQAYGTEYSITNGIVPSSNAKSPRTVSGINLQWLYGLKDPNTGIYIYRPENYK